MHTTSIFHPKNRTKKICCNLFFPIILIMLWSGVPGSAQIHLIDDLSDGSNINDFEYYWDYYDDNFCLLAEDRQVVDPTSTPSTVDVQKWAKGTERTALVPLCSKTDYEFMVTADSSSGNKFATMPFTLGSLWKTSYGTASPFVGITTMLAAEGKYIDITGIEAIQFSIRSRVRAMTVDFRVETFDIVQDSSYAFYRQLVQVTTEWQLFTIYLDSLKQPVWTPPSSVQQFSRNRVTRLGWGVVSYNEFIKPGESDTLDLDDIKLIGPYRPDHGYNPTVPMGRRDGLLASFEGDMPQISPLKTYWYAFDDHSANGNSQLPTGATKNSSTGLYEFIWKKGSGSDGIGTAAAIEFTLGNQLRIKNPVGSDSVKQPSFVGIGINLYDSVTATYFDATVAGRGPLSLGRATDRIYFEYLFDGDPRLLTIELYDSNDVGDARAPLRHSSRGPGIVYHQILRKKVSYGWSAAEVKFSDLFIDSTQQGHLVQPLNIRHLAKIQFKITGVQGNEGLLAIDNIAFPPTGSSVSRSSTGCTGTFSTRHLMVTQPAKNSLYIRLNDHSPLVNGRLSLVNIKGSVIFSSRVSASEVSAIIIANNVPSGLYFVKIDGIKNGKPMTLQTAVTLYR